MNAKKITIIIVFVLVFLTGFFMGSIFPGSIGCGTVEFPTLSVLVSGFLMSANQVGTGAATNVLGHFSGYTSTILGSLILFMMMIFVLFLYLKRNSKIEEAF